ncbi:hypothetical protein FACS1894187_24880 [Synergistales bacterium]|nr:hypothetical protein FACS1894187_24880 [Synergistales bacterium]
MLVNVFKRSLLVLLTVVMLASVADAAANDSALVGGKGKSNADDSLERELDGGIKIECKGVRRDAYFIYAVYIVTAEDDTELAIDSKTIYDNKGNEFNDQYGAGTRIGNQNVKNRIIIGGIPTEVGISYRVDSNYKLADVYPRVALTVNGKEVRFRNVPGVQ